jgi:hypothetical protein
MEEVIYKRTITNVTPDESMAFRERQILKVFLTASIRERIQIDHPDFLLSLQQVVDKIGADETRATSD